MILWCKKISISRSWEYVKNGPPAKGALWLLKGSFQSLHWHHNIWIQFRNRCISNMQILSGKGLVIVLAPFIVAEIFKWILCHVYGKITKSVRSKCFLWEIKKKTRAMKGFIFILIASHLSWVASEKESRLMNIIPSNAHISLFIGETNGVLAWKLWSYPSRDIPTPS